MKYEFIVTPKGNTEKQEKSITMTLRVDRALRQQFDDLAKQSERSRNELMCMALRYALEHLTFLSEEKSDS